MKYLIKGLKLAMALDDLHDDVKQQMKIIRHLH